MTFYKGTKHLQDVMTQTVQSYIKQGYVFLLSDSDTSYLTHVDVQKNKQVLRIIMNIETPDIDIKQTQSLSDVARYQVMTQQTIGLYVQDLDTHQQIKLQTFYLITTGALSAKSQYTDSLSEYEAQTRRHYDRMTALIPASALPIISEQKKLKEMVKGQSGFGKKALQGATLMIFRYPHSYRIINNKTNAIYEVAF